MTEFADIPSKQFKRAYVKGSEAFSKGMSLDDNPYKNTNGYGEQFYR